ncbi:MAG TPA: transcription antitermination factor NusB, partial [Chthoniobacteraceae bacterium]
MGMRRSGREAAIQYLYQLDLNARDLKAAPDDFWTLRAAAVKADAQPSLRAFAEEIIKGVASHLEE